MNAKKRYVLALDCGAAHFRIAVFDAALRRLGERSEPLRYTVRVPERVEFDPEVAWRMSVRLIREACAQAGLSPESVCTIALTSQANTFCALDAAGQPLIPFLSWQDHRAAKEAALLNRRLGARFHDHCSWPCAVAGHQAAMMLWLKLHRPPFIEKAAAFVSLPGFLAMRLGAPNIIDANLAAMTGLYSLKTGRWWETMMGICGVEKRQLPILVPLGRTLAKAAPCRDLVLANRANVVLAGNDLSACAYGNFCSPQTMLLTMGHALMVYRVMGHRRGPYTAGGCWGIYHGGGYYDVVTLTQGGAALDWARTRMVQGRDLPSFTEMARRALARRKGMRQPDSAGLFYPDLMNTEKAWVGSPDPGERALAVFEGIGFSLKQLLENQWRMISRLPAIRVTGGGSHNLFWIQLLADILNTRVGRGMGDALYGAARLSCPRSASLSAPREKANVVWFEPREAKTYKALYARWLRQHPG